jgi:hypothetical protein
VPCWLGCKKETLGYQHCVLVTVGQSEELRKPKKQLNAEHVITALDEFKSQPIVLDSNIFVYFFKRV